MTDTIAIPEKCSECYGTDFQVPNCPYQLAKEIQETLEFFESRYDLDLTEFGFNKKAVLNQIKPQTEKCKAQIEERAREVIRERDRKEQEKRMKMLEDDISETKNMLQQLLESQKKVQIFREEQDIDAPVKKVKKPKKKIRYTFHDDGEQEKEEIEEDPDELIPHGGWMKYLRNVKEENVSRFLDEKLRKKHPELSDEIDKFLDGESTDAIKITDNSSGNKMIEYRQMKKRSEIED